MTLDAYIDVVEANTGNVLDTATVSVDMDYVEDNAESVEEWIENGDEWNEISENWRRAGKLVAFNVTNMEDIIEDLKFDEFQDKTQYASV